MSTPNIKDFLNINFSFAPNSSWKAGDYSNLLSLAVGNLTYLETINSPFLPNADSFHLHLTETGISELHNNFRFITKEQLKRLGKVILIIDETHEPYYGSKKDAWVHDYKPEKGCTGSYKFMCVSVLKGEKRFFVDAVPLSVFSDTKKILREMLSYLKTIVCIKVVLMDRGFNSGEIIDIFEDLRLKYLMLYRETAGVKPLIEKTKNYGKQKYLVNKKHETNLVIIKEQIKGKEIVWIFATNLGNCFSYIKLYKKRWNIETGFRVCDEARIKTKSRKIETRYFLFLIAFLFYNGWKTFCNEPLKRVLLELTMKIFFEKHRDLFLSMAMKILSKYPT